MQIIHPFIRGVSPKEFLLLYLFNHQMGVSPIIFVQLIDGSFLYGFCSVIRWEFPLSYLFSYKMGVSPMVFVQLIDGSFSITSVQL